MRLHISNVFVLTITNVIKKYFKGLLLKLILNINNKTWLLDDSQSILLILNTSENYDRYFTKIYFLFYGKLILY